MKIAWKAFLGLLVLLTLASCRTSAPVIPEKARQELAELLPVLREQNPQWLKPRMELLPSESPDELRLLLGGHGLQDVSALKKFQFEELILDRTGNADLRFINELRPRSLMVFSDIDLSLLGIGNHENLRDLSVRFLGARKKLPELSLKPLANLELRSLRIENARIIDAAASPSLEKVTFESCLGLADLSFLMNLRKLETLQFANCQDLQTGKLPTLPVTELSLVFSPLSEPAALKRLYNLRTLTLSAPERIEYLRGMKLTSLAINGNTKELDISVLGTLPLKNLELSAVQIPDLKPLSNCRELEALNLTLNGIDDISPLRDLPLRALFLAGNNIETLEPLYNSSKLEVLYLTQCPVTSLEPLEKLPLKTLKIERCLIFDLKPLHRAPLRTLWLINCPVADISPLAGTAIRDLLLNDCSVIDLAPLTGMTKLQRVELQNLPALKKALPEGIRGEVIIKEDGL